MVKMLALHHGSWDVGLVLVQIVVQIICVKDNLLKEVFYVAIS